MNEDDDLVLDVDTFAAECEICGYGVFMEWTWDYRLLALDEVPTVCPVCGADLAVIE